MTEAKKDDSESHADSAPDDPKDEPSCDTTAKEAAQTSAGYLSKTETDFVFPIFERVHAYLRRRVAEEDEKALRAEEQRIDAFIDRERSLTRLDNIDSIVENEIQKINNEQQRAENERAELTRTARRRAELFELELEAEKARLVAERKKHDAAGNKYDGELNPSPQPDTIRAGFDEIRLYADYEREIEEWWNGVVEAAGGLDKVSDTQKAMHQLHKDYLAQMMEKRSRAED